MIVAFIVGCEIGFWVLLGAGLVVRYPLRRRRLSGALLLAVPALDVVLLVATTVDLARGGAADVAHGLAAVYLGFTVMFGHGMVRWADQRFAHRFAGGPPPVKPPKSGWGRARYEWREWLKALGAAAIAAALLLGMVVLVGHRGDTTGLLSWFPRLGVVLAVWLAFPVLASLSAARSRSE